MVLGLNETPQNSLKDSIEKVMPSLLVSDCRDSIGLQSLDLPHNASSPELISMQHHNSVSTKIIVEGHNLMESNSLSTKKIEGSSSEQVPSMNL